MDQPLQWHTSSSLVTDRNVIPISPENNLDVVLHDGKTLVVDERTLEEYASGLLQNVQSRQAANIFYPGHFEGSVHIPVAEFAGRVGELGGKDVLLICKTGRRSTLAGKALFKVGYQGQIMELTGGVTGWEGKLDLVK
jgi:rhodanese-related sulfurtransferase